MKHILLLIAICIGFQAKAYDAFIDGFYFNLDSETCTAKVVSGDDRYIGDISIPEIISHNGKEYTVNAIGENSFLDCVAVSSLIIPSSINNIEFNAFLGCKNVQRLEIKDSFNILNVENIKTGAGSSTNNYRSGFFDVAFNARYIYYGRPVESHSVFGLFNYSKVKELVIGPFVEEIPYDAFDWCNGLVDVHIPGNVKILNGRSFYTSNGIKTVSMEEGVESIGAYSFYRCFSLSSVKLPNSIISIGAGTFGDDALITEISLGDKINEIGTGAFSGCNGLRKFYIATKNPPVLPNEIADDNVYLNCTLYVPFESLESYKTSNNWKRFRNIEGFDFSSSIENIIQDNLQDEAEYYTIYGIRLEREPDKGLFLLKRGNHVEKIIK